MRGGQVSRGMLINFASMKTIFTLRKNRGLTGFRIILHMHWNLTMISLIHVCLTKP